MSSKDALIGAKGGSSSFRNTPDNLRSTDTFEALIGLCSGRIRGLAPGGLQNLFIDDVPLEDSTGAANLTDFVATLFDGDTAVLQPITLLLGGSSGPNNINLAVDNPHAAGTPGDWRNGVVTQIGVDFIDLRFVVNALYHQDKTGVTEQSANLEIQLQPSGSTTWINPLLDVTAPTYNEDGINIAGTVLKAYLQGRAWDTSTTWATNTTPGQLLIRGKTTQPFVKELRIAVPNTGAWANKTWGVRVRLIEQDSYTLNDVEDRRTIIWESAAGVTSAPIGNSEEWRGLAYLHVNGKASDQLNGIPNITGHYDLTMCRVPPASVWNSETRVYTGATWDGATEEIKWTQCPAFQLKDLIEDGVSGIAALSPGATLNKWDTLEASKWYAQLVPDGKGGQHCRYSMNYLLDQALSVNDLIQYVAGATGSFAYDEGDGKYRLIVDKPDNAVAIFTKENIVGEFSYAHTDIDTRFNDLTGVFRNQDNRYQEDRVRVFNQEHIDLYGRNHQSIALVGCTNRQEALRRIMLRQLVSLNETRMVTFMTNRQGRMISPFNTILVADQDLGLANVRTTGRLVYRNGTQVNVRDKVRLEVGVTYKMHVTIPNPNYSPDTTSQPTSGDWRKPTITVTRNITNTSGQRGDVTTLYIDSALPSNTPENAPIAFEAVGLPTMPKQYKVTEVEPQDGSELVKISALEVYTAKWDESDAVDEGVILSQVPNKKIPSPTDITFQLNTFPSEFSTKRVLEVAWKRPSTLWFGGFKVEYRLNNGPITTFVENTQESFIEFQEAQDGLYEFRVSTIDRRGGVSQPLIDTYTLGEVPPAGTSRLVLSTAALSFVADYANNLLVGQVPYIGQAQYLVGDGDVSATTTWSVETSGCTVSIDSTGEWTVTNVTTSGYFDVVGDYGGTIIKSRVAISKTSTGTAPSGTVTMESFDPINSGTYPSNPQYTATVTSSSTGKLEFSGNLSYNVGWSSGATRSFRLAGYIVYRVAGSGSGWTAAHAEELGSVAIVQKFADPGDETTGYLDFTTVTTTGLTASTSYEFGVLLRKYSGTTGTDTTPYGSIIAKAVA